MRDITKPLTLTLDGKPETFRLKKLDAFSGAALLRLLAKHLPASSTASADETGKESDSASGLLFTLFTSLSPEDLRSVMISCLNHTEILLPAGYQPIMTGTEWGYPELSHDTAACLRLTAETALWSLRDFFGEGAPASPSGPGTPQPQP